LEEGGEEEERAVDFCRLMAFKRTALSWFSES
jgi:hypothetical protein